MIDLCWGGGRTREFTVRREGRGVQVPRLYHGKGGCVSQTTAHPVTFEKSQEGEGRV